MNKKILVSALAVVMASPVFADDADDAHNVTMSVAEVALVDVTDGDVVFTASHTGEAGANFTFNSPTSGYAITSNIAKDASAGVARAMTAKIDAIDPALKLSTSVSAPTGGTSLNAVELSTTEANVVTGITNVAEGGGTALGITYSMALVSNSLVPTHGDHTIEVTYTLKDES